MCEKRVRLDENRTRYGKKQVSCYIKQKYQEHMAIIRIDLLKQLFYIGIKEFRTGCGERSMGLDDETLALYLSLGVNERGKVIDLIETLLSRQSTDQQ